MQRGAKVEVSMDNPTALRIACFCCGRIIPEGNLFVLVNRLHRIRKATGSDEIISGMASLQICMCCLAQAREAEIEFSETPVPLLSVERVGLYSYARKLDSPTQPCLLEGKAENCSFCGISIGDGNPYIEIEIHEEINHAHPEVVPDSTRVLGLACKECAETYMIWL